MVEESEEDRVRGELVTQLKESLAKSRSMMLNEKLDLRTQERWTQIHTNTSQALNQVLRDRQFKEWEKRLKELEARRRVLGRALNRFETLPIPANQEAPDNSTRTKRLEPAGKGEA